MAILLAGRSDLALFAKMRALLLDALAPIAFAVSRPVDAGRDLARDVGDYLALKSSVDRLRMENSQLQGWQDRARQLEAENNALRSLLKVPADLPARSVTARVVADATSGFMRGVIVLAGSDDGLSKGQAAMTGAGLAGRVLEVGRRASRVLLLTDINSRLPVLIERTRDQAVLAGNNTDLPEIRYLTRDADIKVGDRVVTSGAGGAFPPGLPVGEVVGLGEGEVSVATFADLERLEFIRLVNFGLSGVLADDLGEPGRAKGQASASSRSGAQRAGE